MSGERIGLPHRGPLFADVLAQLDDRLRVVSVRKDTRAHQVQRHAAHQEHLGNQSHSASSPLSRGEPRSQVSQLGRVQAESLAGYPKVVRQQVIEAHVVLGST